MSMQHWISCHDACTLSTSAAYHRTCASTQSALEKRQTSRFPCTGCTEQTSSTHKCGRRPTSNRPSVQMQEPLEPSVTAEIEQCGPRDNAAAAAVMVESSNSAAASALQHGTIPGTASISVSPMLLTCSVSLSQTLTIAPASAGPPLLQAQMIVFGTCRPDLHAQVHMLTSQSLMCA